MHKEIELVTNFPNGRPLVGGGWATTTGRWEGYRTPRVSDSQGIAPTSIGQDRASGGKVGPAGTVSEGPVSRGRARGHRVHWRAEQGQRGPEPTAGVQGSRG